MPLIFVNKDTSMPINSGETFETFIEDPDINKDRVWLRGRAHTLSTLDPLFGLEQHYSSDPGNITFPNNATTTWSPTWYGFNFLKGSIITGGRQQQDALFGRRASDQSMWDTYHACLDYANYPVQRIWKTTNGKYIVPWVYGYNGEIVGDANTGYYLYNSYDTPYFASSGLNTQNPNIFVYEDYANNKIWGLVRHYAYGVGINYISDYETSALSRGSRFNPANNSTVFFMGVGDTGFTYWLAAKHNTVGDPYDIYSYNPTTGVPTRTTMLSNSASTSTRTNNRSFPSNIRRDSATRRVFYSAHFNNLDELAPVRYVWNPSTETTSVVATACTVTYPGSDTYSTYANKYTLEGASTTTPVNSWHCKGHQFTVSGTNYITFWLVDKTPSHTSWNGQSRWSTALKRTMITYTIGAGTADDQLTYHSSYTFPNFSNIPKDFMPINATGTVVATPVDDKVNFYNFDPVNGWQLSGDYQIGMLAMGLDRYSRLWGISNEIGVSTAHLITPTLPVRITVNLPQTAFSYSGNNISTTANVNAFNYLGERLTANVALTIDGTTMKFTTNNSSLLNITTSNSGNTTVDLTITGGGINSIIASAIL
jgi:hypothetical protein